LAKVLYCRVRDGGRREPCLANLEQKGVMAHNVRSISRLRFYRLKAEQTANLAVEL
jgi:hypothetical protein